MHLRRSAFVLAGAALVAAGPGGVAAGGVAAGGVAGVAGGVVGVAGGVIGVAGGVVGVGSPRLLEPAGGAGEGGPTLSQDGRFAAYAVSSFDEFGRLHRRVHHKDLSTGVVSVVNRTPSGSVAGGNYTLAPVISGDGARVAFTSNSSQLTASDRDGRSDAFVRSVPSATTRLVSGDDGQVGTASISGDGRWVVFTSTGTDLVPGSTSMNNDVYVRDLTTGAVRQVTLRPDGSPSRGVGAGDADISADGSRVAFSSYAGDLVAGDDDGELDLFLRDVRTGTTRRLSASVPAGAAVSAVVLSPDARWLATRYADGSVHLIRTSTGATTLVRATATVNKGAFSADGRLMAYVGDGHAYVRDLVTGAEHELPVPGGRASTSAALSGDGLRAAYDWVPPSGGPVATYVVDLTRG